jgi:hypothetical protein
MTYGRFAIYLIHVTIKSQYYVNLVQVTEVVDEPQMGLDRKTLAGI